MSKLTAENIVKSYRNKEVLHSINLELESGKIYGLIGRNGAGKTTLLSILTAQNPATSGTVTFNGEPVWENPDVLSHLCFSRELNTMIGGTNNTIKVKEYFRMASIFFQIWDQNMADQLVKEFDLDVKKKINKLSKGMLSMVSIITALASKAEFTFLDEPTAGLDVIAREKFYRILVDEFSETGRTFVVSTHIIEEAADIFEEVIIVDKGNILLKEKTDELLDRCVHISGHQDQVDQASKGLDIYHEEHLGRSKGITIMLKPGQTIPSQYDIDVQAMSLQKIFIALCGEEA